MRSEAEVKAALDEVLKFYAVGGNKLLPPPSWQTLFGAIIGLSWALGMTEEQGCVFPVLQAQMRQALATRN